MGLTKHVQAYSMSYYTLFNEKTIKKTILLYLYSKPTKDPIFYPGAPPAVPMSQIMYHNVFGMY